MNNQTYYCANCNAELQGLYCSQCGEKRIENKDKRVQYFLEEAISSVFVADGKFFKTIRLLITQPGELTRSFVLGIRKKYLTPLQLFFFANLVYFIFPFISTFNTTLEIQLTQLPYSDYIEPMVTDHLEANELTMEAFKIDYERVSNSNGKLLLIILVILQGLFLKVLFLKRKDLFLLDFLAGSAYFYGFYILFLLVLLPASFTFLIEFLGVSLYGVMNEVVITVILLFGIVIYMYFLIKRAYNTSPKGAFWRSVLLGLFIVPTFIIYRFILFWITFWMVA